MTGRERVAAVFEGRTPDRPPIWEQGFANKPASEIMGRPMKTGGGRFRFEMAKAVERGAEAYAEYFHQSLVDIAALADALQWDIVSVPWGFGAKPTQWIDENTFITGEQSPGKAWSVHRFDPPSDTIHEIATFLDDADISKFERYVDRVEAASKNRPSSNEVNVVPPEFLEMVPPTRMVAAGCGGLSIPYRPARWLEVLGERPDLIERWLDVQVESARAAIPAAARQGLRLVNGGGDFCYNSGPMYSPKVFHDLMLPRLQEIVRLCNEHGLWYIWRTDGWTWPVAEDLFRASGVHAYGEIDAQAGMDLTELRREFPQLVLVGGIDCGQLLQNGAPEQIAEATRHAIEVAAPRYMVGSSNVIHSEIPAENYLAMWRVAVESSS
jgi:uroporphyrinogen-III decarboxylase